MSAEFPKTLFVRYECMPYPMNDFTQLVGYAELEMAVPDNEKENPVAIYQLVSIDNYKKVVTRTSKIEKVKG